MNFEDEFSRIVVIWIFELRHHFLQNLTDFVKLHNFLKLLIFAIIFLIYLFLEVAIRLEKK